MCPHDCPSCCALEVEVIDDRTIGRVRGADTDYTAGVICAKVARYSERIHHPDRLLKPLRRTGTKGSGSFQEISWDAALDEVAEAFTKAEQKFGSETVWPYQFAGTMGLVQRDSIHRLKHVKKYSGQYDTICTNMAWNGWIAGTGILAGADPREMAKSDCVVIWGTNPVNTQVNVMTHATRALKERGAKIVAIDVYENATIKQADLGLILKPGTDAALACAVMHVAFRDGYADWDYLTKYTDDPKGLEAHLKDRSPAWASEITGLPVEEVEAFAKLVGETKKTFFRLGYGFTRSRNGAIAMHAASCIAAVTGSWLHEGGGAFHNNGAIYTLDKSKIEGWDAKDPSIRLLDQSRIGPVLTGNKDDLYGGPPVTAMLIQNTNPIAVAPEQALVKQGFARDDLFVCVHEQFMTETAEIADIVLPATMFLEHDDIYKGGGHQYIMLGPKLVEAPGEARENMFVLNELAKRLDASHEGFEMTPREHIDWMLQASGFGTLADLEVEGWTDVQPPFETAHFIDGYAWPDKKFRFKPDWSAFSGVAGQSMGPWRDAPEFPDHWEIIDKADDAHPFRLVTAPARSFLNTTFNETPGSVAKEGVPSLLIHPEDADRLGLSDGDPILIGNEQGEVPLSAKRFAGVRRGVVIAEGLWPNKAHSNGAGINTLTSADTVAPAGGAAFHDTKVWVRAVS